MPPRTPTPSKKRAPTRSVEKALWAAGHEIVVGIDEVGRGAWAGPLMVGAAVLPRHRRVNGVRDSKLLTEREREILRLLAEGASNQEIAERLTLVVGTVKAHNHSIFGKLGVSNRTQAIARARELNLL